MIKNIFKHKKLIIAAAVIVAIILTFSYMIANADSNNTVGVTGIIPEKKDLKSTISATGMVQSVDSRSVFSTQAFKINSVDVSVGDVVTEGDILAQLDTVDLELQISQQRAALGAQSAAAGQQVNVAAHNLENARFTNDAGLNAQIISAQSAVDSATLAVEMAKQDVKSAYDAWQDAEDDDDDDKNSSSSGSYTSLDDDYSKPSRNGVYVPDGLSDGGIGDAIDSAIDDTLSGLTGMVEDSLGQMTGSLAGMGGASKTQMKNAYDKAVLAQKNAEQQLATAQKQRDAVLSASGIELSAYEMQLQTARVNTNYSAQEIAIQSLEKTLEDATIKAPMSGTVTAVFAEEGGNGTGLLFVIEDTDNLEIETSVSEFDLLNVVPGMKVVVKTDATGDEEFDGVVAKVSPTALKSQTGENIMTTNSQFGVTINVESGNNKLKVGMNAKLDLIAEERDNVYSVPYDVLQQDENGDNIIFMLTKDIEGKDTVKSVPVETGIETDFYVELVGITFEPGDIIISTTEPIQDGVVVTVENAESLGLSVDSDEGENNNSSDAVESEDLNSK